MSDEIAVTVDDTFDVAVAGNPSVVAHTHPASEINDSTIAGRAVLKAATAADQRVALGLDTTANQTFTGSGTGSVIRTVQAKIAESLSLKDFGAVGDGVADDTAAVQAWFSAVLSSGVEGFAPAGTYKVTSAIVFDYAPVATKGFTLRGEGVQKTLFSSTITSAGAAAFSIVTSGGTVPSPKIGVYPKISQIGFLANFAGSTMRIGYTNYSDQQNLVRLECWISNSSDAAGANCLEMNSCYGCHVAYNGGLGTTANAGDNLRLRQCSFGHFFVSMGGTASGSAVTGTGVGIKITDSFSYGNVFVAPDIEYFDKGLIINSANAVRNTFIGGQWGDFGSAVVSCTAGSENRFINPNMNAPLVPFAESAKSVGIVRDTWLVQTATPSSGGTVSASATTRYLKLTPSGTLATLTVNLPTHPTDQQVISIQTYAKITALTLVASGTASIFDAVTTLGAGESASFLFNASGNTWLRVEGGAARENFSIVTAAPSSGSTVTISNTTRYYKVTASGTLATLTINLPTAPEDQQVVTIQTLNDLTALTLVAGGTSTIYDTVTTLAAGNSVTYLFNLGANTWLRVQ